MGTAIYIQYLYFCIFQTKFKAYETTIKWKPQALPYRISSLFCYNIHLWEKTFARNMSLIHSVVSAWRMANGHVSCFFFVILLMKCTAINGWSNQQSIWSWPMQALIGSLENSSFTSESTVLRYTQICPPTHISNELMEM